MVGREGGERETEKESMFGGQEKEIAGAGQAVRKGGWVGGRT